MGRLLKCTYCKERRDRETGIRTPAGFFCSIDHARDYAVEVRDKQVAKRMAKALIGRRKEAKADRKAHKEAKERIKPKAKWLSELQALVNKYVRLRDRNDGCISCPKSSSWAGQWHASHYYSRGHSSSLRFNLWNVHKSCSVCNNHLSGNIGEYAPRLLDKIGQARFDYLLEHKSDVVSYDVEWIKRAIKIAKKAVKRLEKRL